MKPFAAVVLAAVLVLGCGASGAQDKGGEKESSSSKRPGWLGVSIQDVTPRVAREHKLAVKSGALVIDVVENSPAEAAGITEDDVITGFNGKAVEESDDLLDAVRAASAHSQATVDIQRGSERKTVTVTLGRVPRRGYAYSFRMPRVPPVPRVPHRIHIPDIHIFASHGVLGMTLSDLNRQLGEYFEAPEGRGVLVQEVEKGSAADKAGFKAGDVITKVGKDRIEDVGDIMESLEEVKKDETVDFSILRKGATKTLSMKGEDLSPLRFERFRYRDMDDDDADDLGFQKNEFKLQMERLKDDLRSIGREIRAKMEQFRRALRKEIRAVVS
ncbi:MAG: PDZ domain-containing protein [Bacteroidota bacterium]